VGSEDALHQFQRLLAVVPRDEHRHGGGRRNHVVEVDMCGGQRFDDPVGERPLAGVAAGDTDDGEFVLDGDRGEGVVLDDAVVE
jgi:hypothetical protein